MLLAKMLLKKLLQIVFKKEKLKFRTKIFLYYADSDLLF